MKNIVQVSGRMSRKKVEDKIVIISAKVAKYNDGRNPNMCYTHYVKVFRNMDNWIAAIENLTEKEAKFIVSKISK